MAVNFSQGVSAIFYAYYTTGSPAVAMGDTVTIFAWVSPSLAPGALGAEIAAIVNVPPGFGGFNKYILQLTTGRLVNARAGGNPGFQEAFSSTAAPLNTWSAVAAGISATSIKAYLNGVSGTENTTAWSGGALEDTIIGAYPTTTVGEFNRPWKGCIAYVTMWDILLSDSEHALLAAGATPNTIQPDHIILYVPFIDEATADEATYNGSPVTLNYKIYNSDPTNTDSTVTTCASEPPIEPPEPPVPSPPGAPKYYIERMDNRIWPTIEQAWCLDAALRYPMPQPAATLTASSATGERNITSYNIINGGSGYTDPIGQVIDLMGTGSGALCDLTVSAGIIVTAISVANGEDYGHPVVSILDTTGVGGVVQPIVTNYVTFSANTSSIFTSSDVGSIIRMGGGRAEIITVSSSSSVIANIIAPITYVTPNDPYNTPVAAVSGSWSMTAPTMTLSGLDHLEGLTVAALADGGVVPNLTVSAGSVTLPVEATAIVVGLPFVAQLQTMYMDLGGGPTVQGRRKDVTQVILRVESSRAPEIGLNQPDAAAQPNQAEPVWGVQIPGSAETITAMTQIQFRMPQVSAGQPVPLWSGDLPISNVFSTWDQKGQVAVQQRECVPLGVTALISSVKVGDSTGQG